LSSSGLFCGLGSLSTNNLLLSQGKTKDILKINLLTLVTGIPLSFILIPPFGVIGFIAISLIVQATGTTLYIYWVRKLFKFKIWSSQLVRIYVAALAIGGLVWVISNALRFWIGVNNDEILLGADLFAWLISYLVLLPLTGAIESVDLENINAIFGKSGFLAPVLNILLNFMKRVAAIRSRKNN
jgi:O-antigen/teichoic acid export membrane protein